MLKNLPQPPYNTKYVERQAGGHWAGNGDDLPPNLQHIDGTFLKLIRDSPRYLKELNFYKKVFDEKSEDQDLLKLRPLLPKYFGVFRTRLAGKEVQYLKLEDITKKYRHPCLLDVKLKANIHDPQSQNKHKTCELACKMGFLLDGMQVYNKTTRQYKSYQKKFGQSLDEEGTQQALKLYVSASNSSSKIVVQSFLVKLKAIQKWTEKQKSFKFYRSSLLLVYDGHRLENDILGNYENYDKFRRDNLTDIRILDFPKVYESQETDLEFSRSIENLIWCFKKLL